MSCEIEDLIDNRTGDPTEVNQGQSFDITGTFLDEDGTAITLANIATFVFALYDEDTNASINSHTNTDAKNANNHVVTSAGAFTIRLQAADNTIVSSDYVAGDCENHIIKLTWTWNDGVATRTGIKEYRFSVRKLATVT